MPIERMPFQVLFLHRSLTYVYTVTILTCHLALHQSRHTVKRQDLFHIELLPIPMRDETARKASDPIH